MRSARAFACLAVRQPASATQGGFGKPRNDLDFQQPRIFRFSVGLRF